MEEEREKEETGPVEEGPKAEEGLLSKYGPKILLGALIFYVILLATGVIADIFKIQPILDWWIWSPPSSIPQ